jgi:ribosomal protein L7/L12
MCDKYRRVDLVRLVTENNLTRSDLDVMQTVVDFINTDADKPKLIPQFRAALASAEKRLCEVGEKIAAIVSVRERTDLGLKDAKDLVDAYVLTDEYRKGYERHLQRGGHDYKNVA